MVTMVQETVPSLDIANCTSTRGIKGKRLMQHTYWQFLCTLHQYPLERIWNCDESGTQTRRNDGGAIIACKGACHVHSVILDQQEWLSILACMNATRLAILSFYVFKGMGFCEN